MNKISPLVSIVTVVYNDILNIERTIKSVINQTYLNIEYIIIDGGSNDGTLEILKNYRENISCLISEKDFGIYDAMNKSLSYLHGTYVYFLNSGDIIFSNETIELIIGSSRSEDVIYCDTILAMNGSNFYLKGRKLSASDPMPFCHQSVLVNLLLLQSHKFNTTYKVCADKDFFKYCLDNKANFKYINIPFGQIESKGYSNLNRITHIKENQLIVKERYYRYIFKLVKQYLVLISLRILPREMVQYLRMVQYKNSIVIFPHDK